MPVDRNCLWNIVCKSKQFMIGWVSLRLMRAVKKRSSQK